MYRTSCLVLNMLIECGIFRGGYDDDEGEEKYS